MGKADEYIDVSILNQLQSEATGLKNILKDMENELQAATLGNIDKYISDLSNIRHIRGYIAGLERALELLASNE